MGLCRAQWLHARCNRVDLLPLFSFCRYIRSERSVILINFCLSIISSNALILIGQTQTRNKVDMLDLVCLFVCFAPDLALKRSVQALLPHFSSIC